MFEFIDIKRIIGKEIDLVCIKKKPENKKERFLPTYVFKMVLHRTDMEVGHIDLRVGQNDRIFYGGNIGYGVNEEHRGHRYAAKACLLLRELALNHGMDHVIITNNPDNMPSRRTCEIIGAKLIEIVDLPEDNDMYKEGERQKCRYLWDIKMIIR